MGRVLKIGGIIVVIVALVVGLFVYKLSENRTYYNDNMLNGNTPGNLYGEGRFCEANNVVYFANPSDDNSLYSMTVNETDVKKLCDDRVYFINADPHYIYYCRDNNNDESAMAFLNVNIHSLCRYDIKRNRVKILDDAVSQGCSLSQNTVAYYHYDDEKGTTLYSVNIDGEDKKMISEELFNPSGLVGSKIYYAGEKNDHNLHYYDLLNSSSSSISDVNVWQPIVVGNTVYYIDIDNNHQISMCSLSDNSVTHLSQFPATSFTVQGNYIFYQSLKGDPDGVYRIDMSTNEEQLVKSGQFYNLNTTSKYLYMVDFKSNMTYHCPLNGTNASVFSPNIELEK